MPSSMLFGINSEGRVYSLYTNGTKWREFPYLGVEFKKLSSIPNFLWAVGGDRQIYVHVHGFDIPIRIKEEVYENQRWNPIEGFVSRLLPTDRYQWSNKDGTQSRKCEYIKLPSMVWQWESGWQKELSLDGQPLDHDGWTYAKDFPNTYTPNKQWASTVRRRKWFRYRRYSAMNSWCAISPLYKDPTQEPFIDVCIGGQSLPGDSAGTMLVWAVTAHGRLMFRSGVNKLSPEGQRWIPVSLPPQTEINSIACGPTGLMWAITFTGQIIVRTKIIPETPMGESWLDVENPDDGGKMSQVSIGTNVVWAITENNRVWFRKGISPTSDSGTGWIEMVGKMSSISVASNDQVFAVGFDDQRAYYRMGVTPTELTGRKWRPLKAPIQLSRNSTHSNSLLSFGKQTAESSITEECNYDEKTSKSAPTRLTNDIVPDDVNSNIDVKCNSNSLDCVVVLSKSSRLWNPISSVGSLIGMELNPDTDDSGLDPDTERDAFLEKQNDSLLYKFREKWNCIEAGAVYVSPNNIPDWFVYDKSQSIDERTPWRLQVLTSLQERRDRETKGFENYEVAVNVTSWVKSLKCKVQLPGSTKLEDLLFELAWIGEDSDARELALATITFLTTEGRTIKLDLNISDVTSVQSATEPGTPKIKLFSSLPEPVLLVFPTDTEHDDCLAHIIYVCSRLYKIRGAPSNKSFWATTSLGEVLVFDPLVYEGFHPKEKGQLCQFLEMKKDMTPPITYPLVNSFPPGTQLIVTGYILRSASRFSIDLECGSENLIALHVNPRFDQLQIIRNNKSDGVWGEEETYGPFSMDSGTDFMITIACNKEDFYISRNGLFLAPFEHRVDPNTITHVTIRGDVTPLAIKYISDKSNFSTNGIYWRQMGGHLKQVETCDIGVTWGIGHDKTPWVYTGGWGGSFLMGLERSEGINTVTDTHVFELYENQRWNPLSGYTSRGLLTDRPMWSDETGKEKKSKESCRLQNMHWHWETDWTIDYNVPGGADKEGWQYALDFPCMYHAKKSLTDTVRRRKWIRVARYISTGPWTEVGNTKLNDISLHTDVNGNIHVWAIVSNGDVLYRRDVTQETPYGISWEHVSHDEILSNISGYNYQVWAVGQDGCAFYRYGISNSNVVGESWKSIDSPKGRFLLQISVGNCLVWARCSENKLYIRQGVTPVCNEGTHWEKLAQDKMKFICINQMEVWGITEDNILKKRIGVTKENPSGNAWVFNIQDGWTHLSVK